MANLSSAHLLPVFICARLRIHTGTVDRSNGILQNNRGWTDLPEVGGYPVDLMHFIHQKMKELLEQKFLPWSIHSLTINHTFRDM